MPVSQDLKWKAAVLDGFAVLIGILLAFAIDAWWDLRSQNEEAQAYLDALETELLENRRIIDGDIELLRIWVAESHSYLEDVVSPSANPSYDQVERMVWRTGPAQTTPLLRAALDDLKSSGGLQSIKFAELRHAIADYDRKLDRDASELDDVRDNFREYILQYHIEYGSFTEFEWEEYAGVEESIASFEVDAEAFAANRTYANLLIVRILNYSNLRDTHLEVQEQIDRVLGLIPDSPEQ
jgi:hypothetical protein